MSSLSDRRPADPAAVPPDAAEAVAGLPDWLPRVAVADAVSTDLFLVAATSAGGSCAPGGCHLLLGRLHDAGLLAPDQHHSGGHQLRPHARQALLGRLEDSGLDPAGVRRDMLAAGLRLSPPDLVGQLAEWAQEARDWAGLETLWLGQSPAVLMRDDRVRHAFCTVPAEQRAERPTLSYAAALAGAYDADADLVDLDQMTITLVREGRTLHADWSRRPAGEAAVVAGTLWMLAAATMPVGADAPWPDGPSPAYEEVLAVIGAAARQGVPVSAWAISFFHATAALMALPRADWRTAGRNAELAMLLSENCGLPGFLGALVMATSAVASGNSQHHEPVQRFLARHAEHDCRAAAWLEPGMRLIRAAVATRGLDHAEAERQLGLHEDHRTIAAWFDFQAMHALVRSVVGVLWQDAESTLARFDAIIAASPHRADASGPWGGLVLRSRAELLLATGATNRARQLVEALLARPDDEVSTVPAALLYLRTGDLESAIATAEDGIYSLHTSLDDRAQLHAVRAAALWLADDPAATSAAAAACVVCEEAATLVPFAVLPPAVRSALLARHEEQHGDAGCFLARAVRRDAFAGLRAEAAAAEDLIRLTPREKVLLPLLAGPATAKEIADQLYVSVNTVRKQVVSLRGKLGASSRGELVRKAHDLGLLPRD
jgi:DNA-binding NarL/FixJ family response regulator